MIKYENKELCKKCGGECCKTMGCHLSPEDIKEKITFEALEKMIETGIYSIDWWEGYETPDGQEVNGYFLRMRNVHSNIVDPSWGGRCIMLAEDGCELKYEDRPRGGRLLIPNEEGGCVSQYNKKQCADDWFKYYDILSDLVNRLR